MRRGRPPHPDILTPRQREVLDLVRAGLTNQQIADRLGLTERGAKYHVSEILSKLGFQDRKQAAKWSGQLRGGAVGVIAFVTRKIRPAAAMLPKAGAVLVGTAAMGLLALALGVAVMDRRAGQSETRLADQERLTADGPGGYDTPAQAAQAAGFDLPSVSAPGWATMSPVFVQKSQRQPSGLLSVLMAFENRNSGGQIELLITSPGGPPEATMPEPVTLASGREVRLGRQGNQVGVKWNEGGRSFTASTVTSDRFSEADFLLVLASLQ